MKQRKSRLHHDTLALSLRQHFPLHATRLTVLCALVLAMIRARSVVLYTLVTHLELPGSAKVRYKRLKRFVQFTLSDTYLASLVLNLLPRGQQWLILDRTHWKLGKTHINILLLSVVWQGFSLPLVWTVLTTGGHSTQAQRITLLERVRGVLPAGDTLGILGDREFIGRDWFVFLRAQAIEVCIRLKKDARVDDLPVQACFLNMKPGELRVWHRAMKTYGVKLRILALCCASGEMLYLAYQGYPKCGLRRYAQRWQCENMHQSLKGRGFNLEDSGLSQPQRVSTLLGAVGLAFVWCCLTGTYRQKQVPIPLLSHGYAEQSLFRYGLEHLQDIFFRLVCCDRHEQIRLLSLFDP